MEVLFDDHTPPVVEHVNEPVWLLHTLLPPLIAATEGAPVTVMFFVTVVVPHALVTA
jgi:hypothetical protein